jgi:hypothetical protein
VTSEVWKPYPIVTTLRVKRYIDSLGEGLLSSVVASPCGVRLQGRGHPRHFSREPRSLTLNLRSVTGRGMEPRSTNSPLIENESPRPENDDRGLRSARSEWSARGLPRRLPDEPSGRARRRGHLAARDSVRRAAHADDDARRDPLQGRVFPLRRRRGGVSAKADRPRCLAPCRSSVRARGMAPGHRPLAPLSRPQRRADARRRQLVLPEVRSSDTPLNHVRQGHSFDTRRRAP